jgi:nucleotide-binding universal stress UspA family protein
MLKVLIPVDGSENALGAVRHVINRYIEEKNLEVHLLHVCTRLPQEITRFISQHDIDAYHHDEAEKTLNPARELLTQFAVPFESHVGKGDKAEVIHKTAQAMGINEIVIGTGRKNSFTRLIEGSLTNRVMELSDVPVEVIAQGEESKLEKYGLPAGIGAALTLLFVANE